jgi:multiple sugar transport system substrate-binding protein
MLDERAGLRLACATAAVLLLVSCRSERDGEARVELWAMGREGEVVQALVPGFERSHPDLRVHVQQIPWSAAHEKLLTAYVGGSMPDVFQLGATWVPEFVALGALEPLDGWIAGSTALRPSDFFPGILDANVIEGATWGIPWYVDTRLLFYRSDAFAAAGVAAAPRTWSEWLDALVRVKARAGPDRFAILLPLAEWEPPVILALQRGAELLRDGDRHGNFRSPAFREAFRFYLDLFRRGLAPGAQGTQVANLYQDFAAGWFACWIGGPWNLGELERRLPPGLRGSWATAPLPGPDPGRPGVSLAGGASLAIHRGSPRKQAAWRLVEYLSQPERQLEFHTLSGDLPARADAWADPALARDRRAGSFFAQLQHVKATPKIPEWERIAQTLVRHSEAAVRGDESVDEALEKLDAEVDRILEKRRWLLDRAGR